MSPAIRLGSRTSTAWERKPPIERGARLHRRRLELGGVATRAIEAQGEGPPALLMHGWCDSADTWLAVLERISRRGGNAIAYDMPGFGVTGRLPRDASVLDSLVDFAAAAVMDLAERTGKEVIVVGNSLGGWTALRLAERCEELPIKAIVPIAPAGVKMAPLFFALDRIPAVAQIVSMPAPRAVTRGVVGRVFRQVGFSSPSAAEQAVVDRFTRFNADRRTLAQRIRTAQALRSDLDNPFDPEKITCPVTVIWGDKDRLCIPAGARHLCELLPHAKLIFIPDCGHMPQHEAPEMVVSAIAELS